MSYSFDGSNDRLAGTLTTAINTPFTMGVWVKTASFVANDVLMALSEISGDETSSAKILKGASANLHSGEVIDSADVASRINVDIDVGTGWVALVLRVSSSTLRDLFVVSRTNTGQTTASKTFSAMAAVRLGENAAGTSDFAGLLAEAALWDKALTDAEVDDYMAGVAASGVAASDLVGYWPLDTDNATQANEGVDATGDLTVTSATFNADHPTITSGPTVTDVDTDESITGTQANVVVTGTSFGASQGAGHVKVFDGSLSVTPTIDTWADTSIQFDMSIGTSTGIRYGSRTLRVTDNAAAFDEIAITVTAPATVNYVDLTTLADPADRLTTTPTDMEAGDQLEWSNVVGTGMTIADVTVYPDGSFSFTDGVESFDFRVHDVTTGWGAIATVTTAGLVPTITTTTLPNGTDGVIYSNTVVADGDAPITFSLLSGSLPNGLALSTAGEIDGIPTLPGVYSFTVRATNSFGTDDQALTLTVAEAGVTGALASPRKVVFALSGVTGLTKWADYWPVKVVAFTEGSAGRHEGDGCVAVRALASSSGLVAWVDYIPVYDTGSARNRYDNDGYIPVDTLTP